MRTVSVLASSRLNGFVEGYRQLGLDGHARWDFKQREIVSDSGDQDGLHRIVLASGDVIEVTVAFHARSVGNVVSEG